MPHDDPGAPRLDEHPGADLAGERPRVPRVHVLAGHLDAASVALVGARRQRGKGGRDEQVDVHQRRRQVDDVGREGEAGGAAVMHLPVASDERASLGPHETSVLKTSMPGSFFPSTSSSEAPPPVEMCFILPATSPPAAWTAAALSPPPTTVKALESPMARATEKVPFAKG